MKLIYRFILAASLGVTPHAVSAQTATVRVPQCLQYRNTNVYIPCTGVVPVDSETGNAISWEDLFDRIPTGGGGGGGGGGDPTSTATIGSAPPAKGSYIAGYDGSVVRAISTDTSGRINAAIFSLPAITGTVSVTGSAGTVFQQGTGVANANSSNVYIGGGSVAITGTAPVTQSGTWNVGLTGTLPAFGATPTFNVGGAGLGTLTAPLIIGCTDSSNVRVGCSSGAGGGGGGDASSANQVSVQANAGADASKVLAVQGVTGGKAIPVTGTFFQATQPVSAVSLPLPIGAATAAKQDSLLTAVGTPYQAGGALPLPTGAATETQLVTAVTRLTTIVTALQGTLTTSGVVTSSALPTGASTAAKQDSLLSAVGSPYQAGGALPLPTGAATAAKQDALLTAVGIPVQAGTSLSNVVQATAVNRGAVIGTTAVALMASNVSRRGFSIQNQSSTASCYINGISTATADFNSLLIGPGGYFEPDHHVGTGAISIICSAATTSVYAREW